MGHHPCLAGICLLKIASLSLYVSRLPLMMTGSYFIILGLELQGVKAICVDTASWTVLPTSPRTQIRVAASQRDHGLWGGISHSEWSDVWGLVKY